MKKLLSLLSVLTISGTSVPTVIAASPYQKEETIKNSDINYQQTNNLESLNRNKRYSRSKCIGSSTVEGAGGGAAAGAFGAGLVATGAGAGVVTAFAGVAAGAGAGSVFPGIGTIIGAIIGAAAAGTVVGVTAGSISGAVNCPDEVEIKSIILNKDLGIIGDDDSISLLNEIKKNNQNLDIENLYIEYIGNDKNMPNFKVEKHKLLNELKKNQSIFNKLENDLKNIQTSNDFQINVKNHQLEDIKTEIKINIDKLKDYKTISAKIIASNSSKYQTDSYVIVNYIVQRDLTDSSYLLIDWIENLYNPWKKDYEEFKKNKSTYSEKERQSKAKEFKNRIAQLRHDLLQNIEIIKVDSYVRKLYERIKSLEIELTKIKIRIDELETPNHFSKCGASTSAIATGISIAEMTLKNLPIMGSVGSAISQLISASCYLASDFS